MSHCRDGEESEAAAEIKRALEEACHEAGIALSPEMSPRQFGLRPKTRDAPAHAGDLEGWLRSQRKRSTRLQQSKSSAALCAGLGCDASAKRGSSQGSADLQTSPPVAEKSLAERLGDAVELDVALGRVPWQSLVSVHRTEHRKPGRGKRCDRHPHRGKTLLDCLMCRAPQALSRHQSYYPPSTIRLDSAFIRLFAHSNKMQLSLLSVLLQLVLCCKPLSWSIVLFMGRGRGLSGIGFVSVLQYTVNSGGLVFFAIFKPQGQVVGESAACIKFSATRLATQSERLGGELARHLHVATPQARVIHTSSSEWQELRATVKAVQARAASAADAADEMLGATCEEMLEALRLSRCFLLMGYVHGRPLLDSPQAFDTQVAAESSAYALGRVMVLDLVLRNEDRLVCRRLGWRGNAANLIFAMNQLIAPPRTEPAEDVSKSGDAAPAWSSCTPGHGGTAPMKPFCRQQTHAQSQDYMRGGQDHCGSAVVIDSGICRRPPSGKAALDRAEYPKLVELLLNDSLVAAEVLAEVTGGRLGSENDATASTSNGSRSNVGKRNDLRQDRTTASFQQGFRAAIEDTWQLQSMLSRLHHLLDEMLRVFVEYVGTAGSPQAMGVGMQLFGGAFKAAYSAAKPSAEKVDPRHACKARTPGDDFAGGKVSRDGPSSRSADAADSEAKSALTSTQPEATSFGPTFAPAAQPPEVKSPHLPALNLDMLSLLSKDPLAAPCAEDSDVGRKALQLIAAMEAQVDLQQLEDSDTTREAGTNTTASWNEVGISAKEGHDDGIASSKEASSTGRSQVLSHRKPHTSRRLWHTGPDGLRSSPARLTMKIKGVRRTARDDNELSEQLELWDMLMREQAQEMCRAQSFTTGFLDGGGSHSLVDSYELKVRLEHVLERIALILQGAATERPSQIMPHLYIGGAVAARSIYTLEHLGITHIVSLCPSELLDLPGEQDTSKFQYLLCEVKDAVNEDISRFFEEVCDFIDGAAATSDGKVLVHCYEGRSRSVAITLAYLMMRKSRTLAGAWSEVRAAHPRALPNDGFMRKLVELDRTLHSGTASMEWRDRRPTVQVCPWCARDIGMSSDSLRVHIRRSHPDLYSLNAAPDNAIQKPSATDDVARRGARPAGVQRAPSVRAASGKAANPWPSPPLTALALAASGGRLQLASCCDVPASPSAKNGCDDAADARPAAAAAATARVPPSVGGPAFLGQVFTLCDSSRSGLVGVRGVVGPVPPLPFLPKAVNKHIAAWFEQMLRRVVEEGPTFCFFVNKADGVRYLRKVQALHAPAPELASSSVRGCPLEAAYQSFKRNPRIFKFVANDSQVKVARGLLHKEGGRAAARAFMGVPVFTAQDLTIAVHTSAGIKWSASQGPLCCFSCRADSAARFRPYFFDARQLNSLVGDSVDHYYEAVRQARAVQRRRQLADADATSSAEADDDADGLVDPPELHDLMEEMGQHSGGVLPPVESVLAKAAECRLADCVDNVLLGRRWARRLTGLQPSFSVLVDSFERRAQAAEAGSLSLDEDLKKLGEGGTGAAAALPGEHSVEQRQREGHSMPAEARAPAVSSSNGSGSSSSSPAAPRGWLPSLWARARAMREVAAERGAASKSRESAESSGRGPSSGGGAPGPKTSHQGPSLLPRLTMLGIVVKGSSDGLSDTSLQQAMAAAARDFEEKARGGAGTGDGGDREHVPLFIADLAEPMEAWGEPAEIASKD
eukprot:SM000023S07696  [mRNA]  locus=s23:1003838:1017893:+ [translate_table: standard]